MSSTVISFPFLGENFSVNPPKYFDLFGRHIYLYGLIITIGCIVAFLYISKRCRTFGLTSDNVLDIILCAVPAGIVGARIYYVVFNPEGYFGAGNWGNIVKIWEGGLAIYGGIIFGVIGLIIYARKKKIPIGTVLDLAAFGVIIGQIFGRWGNFFNREAFGDVTDSFFRMGLTTSSGTVYVHPTFLYESVWNLIGFIFLHFYSKKHRRYDGQMFILYVAWYGLGRYFIEGLRADSLYIGSTDIRVSQLLAAISFGAAVCLLIINRFRKNTKPLYSEGYEERNAKTEKSEEVSPEPAETDTEDGEKVGDEEDDDEYEYVFVDEDGNEVEVDNK